MSMSTGLSEQARERLSRLVDGEGEPDELHRMLQAGRDSPGAWSGTLESWHVYHLVGDVMRSEELAGQGRDDAFLARLRERLAEEPVVMAPVLPREELSREAGIRAVEPQGAVRGAALQPRRRSWRAPLAAAAGVMAVAGVAMMTGLPGSTGDPLPAGPVLVQAPAATAAAPALASAGPGAAEPQQPRVLSASGPLLRDARLDQYLSAHKQFGGSSALGVPSGFLRSATYEGPSH